VAISAKQLKIDKPIVQTVSIHVMQLQAKRPAQPSVEATALTTAFRQTLAKETIL